MRRTEQPWCVLLAVAPPLLGELLSDLIGRADLAVSLFSSLTRPSDHPHFDVGILDRPLPAWVDVARVLRLRPWQEGPTVAEPPAGELSVVDIDGLRLALATLCPPRVLTVAPD